MTRRPNLQIYTILCISICMVILTSAELIQPALSTKLRFLLPSNINTTNSLPSSTSSSASQPITKNQPYLAPSVQAVPQASAQSQNIQANEPSVTVAAGVSQKLVQFDLGTGINSRVQETDQFLQELEDMIGQYEDGQNLQDMDILIEMDEIGSAHSNQIIQQ